VTVNAMFQGLLLRKGGVFATPAPILVVVELRIHHEHALVG
jgi:hypothetical protein